MTTQKPVCPHCNQPLQAFELPDNTGWQGEFHLACFNDECPYFVRGWQHMQDNYAVRSSYRYRIDPETGNCTPLAVWSADAIRDRIINASIEANGVSPDDPENGDRE